MTGLVVWAGGAIVFVLFCAGQRLLALLPEDLHAAGDGDEGGPVS